jgi:hypothetical protein
MTQKISASHIDGMMNYELSAPISYSDKGSTSEATFLTFHEPKGEHAKAFRKITNIIDNVIMRVSQLSNEKQPTSVVKNFDETTEEDAEQDADGLYQLLKGGFGLLGDEDKYDRFHDLFETAVISGTRHPLCKVQDLYPLREAHWEQIGPRDREEIAMRYCAFFGIGYLGDMMQKSK